MLMVVLIIPLMTLMMKQVDNSGALRNKAIANWIAENTLVKLRLDRQLGGASLRRTQDEKVEMAGTQWIVVTEPEETASGALLRYRTTVSLQEGQPCWRADCVSAQVSQVWRTGVHRRASREGHTIGRHNAAGGIQ